MKLKAINLQKTKYDVADMMNFVGETGENIVGKEENAVLSYPLPNKPWFSFVCCTSLLKAGKKEKLLVMNNFSFSHSVFYLFGELSAIFIKFNFVISFSWDQSKILSSGKGLLKKPISTLQSLYRCKYF